MWHTSVVVFSFSVLPIVVIKRLWRFDVVPFLQALNWVILRGLGPCSTGGGLVLKEIRQLDNECAHKMISSSPLTI